MCKGLERQRALPASLSFYWALRYISSCGWNSASSLLCCIALAYYLLSAYLSLSDEELQGIEAGSSGYAASRPLEINMHVLTHLLASWAASEGLQRPDRDVALATWAGLAPDLDGAGLIVDVVRDAVGLPETTLYYQFHHILGHGLPAAIVISGLVGALAVRKTRAAVVAFLTVHLHFLGDLFGSRGLGPMDYWPLEYLAPFSDAWTVSWRGQWWLAGWQNTVISVVLLMLVLVLAVYRGRSPARLFSAKADDAFVEVIRLRWSRIRGARGA